MWGHSTAPGWSEGHQGVWVGALGLPQSVFLGLLGLPQSVSPQSIAACSGHEGNSLTDSDPGHARALFCCLLPVPKPAEKAAI